MAKKRILFIAEAVTLAHVARPFVLAKTLNPYEYDVTFAWDPRYQELFPKSEINFRTIRSISSQNFLKSLAKGRPLYDFATLKAYVDEEKPLIELVKPDLIIGDFRLSLSVSASLANVPCAMISNLYWSPFVDLKDAVPELPVTRLLGASIGQRLFDWVKPIAFDLHCQPIHKLRKMYGLAPLPKGDLRRVYTAADYTLYADIPGIFQMQDMPHTHRIIGPISWSPTIDPPAWWSSVPRDRPLIYLTLGSSGVKRTLNKVLNALADMNVTAMVATAGSRQLEHPAKNLLIADFLPGQQAAEMADLVICNGGSPTTQQALLAGRPVLGLPSNMDQCLNMTALEQSGAGIMQRPECLSASGIATAINQLLSLDCYKNRAHVLAERAQATNSANNFLRFIDDVLPTS